MVQIMMDMLIIGVTVKMTFDIKQLKTMIEIMLQIMLQRIMDKNENKYNIVKICK